MILKKLLITLLILFTINVSAQEQDLEKTLQQTISTSFVNTTLDNALRVLAKQYSLNMVIGGDGSERVTISLFDVPLGEAMNSILKANGYHYVMGNNVLIVKPFAMEMNGQLTTKVFQLKYLEGFKLKTTLEPLLSQKGKVEALLSEPEEKEKFYRSNTIVVTDFWENVQRISQIVEQMDILEEQIQIEVRLVEKIVGDEKSVGLDLPTSVSVEMQGAEIGAPITQQGASGASGEPTLLSAWYKLPNNSKNLSMGVLTFDKLRATLDFLARDNGSKLISNPKVTTLNNKKATVKIGTTIPVPEVSRGVGGDLVTYKDKEVNMRLDVIPMIGEDRNITLIVHPVLEEIVGYTGSPDALQPITSKREVQSTVSLKDGETVVIGGLIKESETETVKKVWLLGDIPILGYLFRHTNTTKSKNDLLIFITTKIMEPEEDQG